MATSNSGLEVVFITSDPAVIDIAGTTATIEGAGEVTIFANQIGNNTSNPAAKVAQTITFNALEEKTYGDSDFELAAVSTSALSISYVSTDKSVAMITGSTVTILGAGTTTIIASQQGYDDYNTAVDISRQLVVNKAPQTIDFEMIANQCLSNGSLTLSATASSELEVSFVLESGPASLETNVVSFLEAGEVTVIVSQEGNNNYEPALPVSQTFTVIDEVPEPQTIEFEAIANVNYGDVLNLSATAPSGLEVSYALINGAATIDDSQVSFSGIGTVTIEARQLGNASYEAASPVQHTFEILPATLVVTADDQTTIYNEAIPELTYKIDGFVNGEDEGELSGLPLISTTAESGDDAGTYTITASGGDAANYNFTYLEGTLTIEKAEAVISISDLEQEADGTAKEVSVSTDPAGLNFTITYDGSSEVPVEAGEYVVEVVIDEINYQGIISEIFVLTGNEEMLSVSKEQSITVYPNPVTDYLKVEGELKQARLINSQGKILINKIVISEETELNLTEIRDDIYFLELTDKTATKSFRKIIKR